MSVYVVAHLDIRDREEYRKYEAGFMEIFQKYEGELLAVDEAPERIEGTWPWTRTVILRFPSAEAVHAWYDSEAYQALVQHRFHSSTGQIAILHGLPES